MAAIEDVLAPGTTLAEAEFNVEMLTGEMQRLGVGHDAFIWGDQHVSRRVKREGELPPIVDVVEPSASSGPPGSFYSVEGRRLMGPARLLVQRRLSPDTLHKMVTMTQQAAVLAYHERAGIYYTQNGWLRWEGIRRGLRAWKGQVPRWADCSSFASWCADQALWHFRFSDRINGLNFHDGYTGTILNHGVHVPIGQQRPGDLIVYGYGFPGEHCVVYTGGGLCVSHGNSAGPSLLPVSWVGHILAVRRFIY